MIIQEFICLVEIGRGGIDQIKKFSGTICLNIGYIFTYQKLDLKKSALKVLKVCCGEGSDLFRKYSELKLQFSKWESSLSDNTVCRTARTRLHWVCFNKIDQILEVKIAQFCD